MEPMQLKNMVAFNVDICDHISPQEFDKRYRPTKLKRRSWIPQTMGDCVWIWYEFESPEEARLYKKCLTEEARLRISKFIDQAILDRFKDCESCDWNGF